MILETAHMLRDARRSALLSQSEVARRAGTSQPAVAAYESGSRVPSLHTLERLLGACHHTLELAARPSMRRGATGIVGLSALIREDLSVQDEKGALRLLFGFSDDFRGSSRPGKIALIAREPETTGDPRFDAALAGLAEFFAREGEIPAPDWVDQPGRFVEPWWFVAGPHAFDAYTLAHTPAVFARHGVFIAREVFDRV